MYFNNCIPIIYIDISRKITTVMVVHTEQYKIAVVIIIYSKHVYL